jgi:hypothetical protein
LFFLSRSYFFYYNGSFVHTKKKLVEQAQKALYAVYYKIRNLQLPIDLQLKIFDSLVAPILSYGSEVWGVGKNDNIENVHLQFLKRISGIWFLKIKLRPILSKIVCIFFTYKVGLFSFAYNLNRSLYILEDNFSVVIKRVQKQSILHLMLMSRGYLPNSPYTK